VWRISTGKQRHVLSGHAQKVYSVVLDPSRNRCISGSMDSHIRIWDLDTGACIRTLEGHTLLVGLLDLRDERLVSAAADSTLRIWDAESGRCRHVLMGHTGAITCFQHDERKIISGSEHTIRMWDANTGDCVRELLSDLSSVWQVRFNYRRCVSAVQREGITYVEVRCFFFQWCRFLICGLLSVICGLWSDSSQILDFGAIRDGVPMAQLGKRTVLNTTDALARGNGVPQAQ